MGWSTDWMVKQSDPIFNANPVTRGKKAGLTNWQNALAIGTGGLTFGGSLQHENAKRDAFDIQRMGLAGQEKRDFQYARRQQLLKQYQGEDDAARNQALGSIESAYANPQRAASYDQSYQSRLGDALAGINQQYQGQSQQTSLAAAAKGRLGSSYDAETQARLRGGAQMSALGAQGDASDYANGLRDTDYAQAQAMRRSMLSGDPQSAAAYQGMAAQSAGQASALSGQATLADRQRLLNQAYGNAQSQQYGGLANAAAGGVQSYYGAYGRNG